MVRLLLAIVVSLVAAAPAQAVLVQKEAFDVGNPYSPPIYAVSLTDEPGRASDVRVTGDRTSVTVAGLAVRAGTGCEPAGDAVICPGQVDWIAGTLGDGDDRFVNESTVPAVDVSGGDGNDVLIDPLGRLDGAAGNDDITGFSADGGDGDDIIRAGAYEDPVSYGPCLDGGAGDDTLLGSAHADCLKGGAGADTIQAGGGDDLVLLPEATDTIDGGDGHDGIDFESSSMRVGFSLASPSIVGIEGLTGSGGDDDLTGSDGAETISGGRGNDHIHGNAGDDHLLGEDGVDLLDGGAGADRLVGGIERDTLDGGDGDDFLDARNDLIDDLIDCGAGLDVLRANAGERGADCEQLQAVPEVFVHAPFVAGRYLGTATRCEESCHGWRTEIFLDGRRFGERRYTCAGVDAGCYLRRVRLTRELRRRLSRPVRLVYRTTGAGPTLVEAFRVRLVGATIRSRLLGRSVRRPYI